MNSLKIKKGDKVIVLSGKEKDKTGKVMKTDSKSGTVVVENINFVKRHTRPRKQGQEGGILSKEAPIRACKVMCVCPKCSSQTRVGYKVFEDGTKTRVCKKCGAAL